MYRLMLFLLMTSTAVSASVSTGHAASSLRDALGDRFILSRIDVQNPSDEGRVVKKGTILVLQAVGIPANAMRSVQLNTKSPRFHARDYARVVMAQDGNLTAAPGATSLTKGTRLVVLDLKVSRDRVRLFTHTLEPVRLPSGKAAYGCAEFVFDFDPATLDRADIGAVAGRIEQWLSTSSAS